VPSATADTNIYVSAYNFGGPPRRFIDLAAKGAFRLDISDAILNETLRVLREKFDWSEGPLEGVESDIRSYTRRFTPTETLDVITADPPDNRILECAAAAKSDYIVTGDTRHILPLGQFAGMPIMKPAAFLKLLIEKPLG
jgi:putative PIN family toxin of toxin-antitoxin system